ncbi:uncharacterized protein LOC144425139 [Styela clava]
MWFLQNNENISTNDTNLYYESAKVYRQWLAAVIFASSTFLLNIYVLVVTLIYEWKVQKENREIRNRIRQEGRYSRMRKHIAVDVIRYLIITFLFLFVVLGFLDAVELRYSFDDEVELCRNLRYVKRVLVAICLFIPFLIYWIRQRQFYKSDLLMPLCNKFMQVLSWLVLAFMIIGVLVGLLIMQLSRGKYSNTLGGCEAQTDLPVSIIRLQSALAYILLVFTELTLVFLFVYPLWKLRNLHKTNSRILMKQIKRSSIATAITIIVMFIGPLISLFSHLYLQLKIFHTLIFEFVILVNTICVIASFNDWKLRLFPFARHVTLVQATITDRPHSHSYHNTTILG